MASTLVEGAQSLNSVEIILEENRARKMVSEMWSSSTQLLNDHSIFTEGNLIARLMSFGGIMDCAKFKDRDSGGETPPGAPFCC